MQDLELKASEQAKHIHAELSVEVIKMKMAQAEQEAQHVEAVKVFLAKIEELEQQKKALQDRAEAAETRESSSKKSADVLNKKLKGEFFWLLLIVGLVVFEFLNNLNID